MGNLHNCTATSAQGGNNSLYYAVCVSIGLYLGFANPLIHLPTGILLAAGCLFSIALTSSSARSAAAYAWASTTLGFSGALYWLVYPMHNIGGLALWAAVPNVILLSAYLATYMTTAVLSLWYVATKLRTHHSLSARHYITLAALFGVICAGFEVLSTHMFTGFPWLNLATAFAVWPAWVQGASLIGSYGLTAYFCFCAGCAASIIFVTSKERFIISLLSLILLTLPPCYGFWRFTSLSPSLEPSITVGMIQGNIDQSEKWDEAVIKKTIATYLKLSQSLLHQQQKTAQPLPDYLLWPETAVGIVFDKEPLFAADIRRFCQTNGITLGFGTIGYRPAGSNNPPALLNRLYFLYPNGQDAATYDKEHLVPFGEYIPPIFTRLAFLQHLQQGISYVPGNSQHAITLPLRNMPAHDAAIAKQASIALGPLICYEVIFPWLAHKRVQQGAQVLVTISNDGWFGTSSAPLQHLYLASMRSIEQQRPMLRATNTGITASIDRFGRITALPTMFAEDTFITSVTAQSTYTMYYYIGIYLDIALLLIALLTAPCMYVYALVTGK